MGSGFNVQGFLSFVNLYFGGGLRSSNYTTLKKMLSGVHKA